MQHKMNDDCLHPLPEVSTRLGKVSVSFIRREIALGRIRSHRIGDRVLVSESEIQRIIQQSAVSAEGSA